MTYVDEFRKRRYQRLKSRGLVEKDAILEFRKRREARLDAGEEEEENGKPKVKVKGHGNTKLPFGLCQREGIQIEKGWTPTDAWNALEGEGYNAKEEYRGLKEGKPSGSSKKAKKEKEPKRPLSGENFPKEMMDKTHGKATREYIDLINQKCDDNDVLDVLSGIRTGKNKFSVKMLKSLDGAQVATYPTLRRVEVSIPRISTLKKQEHKDMALMTFIHEFTHYIDHENSEEGYKAPFSTKDPAYREALNKEENNPTGEKAKKLFEEFNEKHEKVREQYYEDKKTIRPTVMKEMFGENRPKYLREDGSINWVEYHYSDREEYHKYEKAIRKKELEMYETLVGDKRSVLNGVSSLQGLYSDISRGKRRESGEVKYGHDIDYSQDDTNQAEEVLANYMALKAIKPEYAKIFAEDFPETAKALDNMIKELGKKVKGAT